MPRLPAVPPVTVSELAFVYAVGGAAAVGEIPQSGVGGMGVNIENADGNITRYELTDIPLNRAAIAIRNQFPSGQMQPILLRILAMNDMLGREEAAKYIRPVDGKPGEEEVSEAVFRVAACMPLNRQLAFNERTFFKRVAAEYAADPD